MLNKEQREFAILVLGKISQALLVIIGIKVATSLLSKQEMGNLFLFMAIYTFFGLFLINPIGQYIHRRLHAWYEHVVLLNIYYLYNIYIIVVCLISLIAIVMLYHLVGLGHTMNQILLFILLPLYIFSLTWNQTLIATFNMLRYRRQFVIYTVLSALVSLILSIFMVLGYEAKAIYWIMGVATGNLLLAMVVFKKLKNILFDGVNSNIWLKKLSKKKLKLVFNFAFPLSVATFFMWLQNSGYKVVIERQLGLEYLGYFGVGIMISSQITNTFESLVMQYYHPIYFKKITNASKELRAKYLTSFINNILPLYILLVFFVTFNADHIFKVLVDQKFHQGYMFLILGIWIDFPRMVTNLLGKAAITEMKTIMFIWPYMAGGITTILTVWYCAKLDYIDYALPIALVLCSFITMVVMYTFMRSLVSFKIKIIPITLAILFSIPFIVAFFYHDEFESANIPFYIILFISIIYLSCAQFLFYKKLSVPL